MKLFFKNLKQYQLKTIPKLIILSLAVVITAFMYACDKGTDSVDFEHYLDANDRRIVHFNAKGKSDYGDFEYQWQFGDGSVGTGKEITHEFGDFGKFTVILTATIEKSNIETSVVKEIEVVIPKITGLDFEVTPDKKNPRLYNFRAVSNTDYGNIEYDWDFGDGMTTSGDNVQYGFEYFGDYEVSLKATISEYEKVSSVSKQFVKVAAPSITRLDIYAVQDDYNPFLYHFKPIAESSWGTLEYEWSFGDGKIAYDIEEPTNTYSKYASYNVQLKAKIKETGATRTVNQEVLVQTPLFKSYEITYIVDPNDPLQIYFTIENKDGENNEDMSQQDSFTWEFGDGDTSSGLRVNHRYESYGEKIVYVTLRTAQQTQKTLTKTFTLETPYINNIKITGTPSMKAGNIIEYRVNADSKFSDEIEYTWEFEDGTQKVGRAVQREMSFWSAANDSGNITENIYIKASIPRLTVSVKETKEVQVVRPTIQNFKINCSNTPKNNLEWICDPRGLGNNVTSSAGGDIEYEWVFNGQTYTGANQRFTFDTYGASYTITATAKIKDTNITQTDTFKAYARLDGIGFGCTSKILDSNNSDALKLECTAYDDGTHSNVKITWDYGDTNDKYFTPENEHTYEKAGTYPVTMKFSSNQLIKPEEITQDYTVLVNVTSYFDRGSKSGTADCGGRQTDGKYTVYRNNFDLFNQEDFTITNVFSTGNTNCSCKGKGWNFTDNVWHTWNEKSADCWGNIDQWVNTVICAKADLTKCVKNY